MADFTPHLPPEVPYIFCYGQMAAAQSIALKRLFDIRNELG
jgi:beta-glucosidase